MTTEKPGTGPVDTAPSGGGTRKPDTDDEHTLRSTGTRAADLRFVLVASPRTALVLDAPRVAAALERAGVTISDSTRPGISTHGGGIDPEALDIVVATPALLGAALAANPRSIVLTGCTRRAASQRLARAGYSVTRLLVRRGPTGPRLFVPAHGPALRHALLRWWRPPGRLRALRNEVIAALVACGVPIPRTMFTIATLTPGPPWPVEHATSLGVPADATWMFAPGVGDELQRAAFHLFAPGRTAPSWVLKLSRVANNAPPFEADEHGLRLAAQAGPLTSARAPRLFGRLDLGGLPASLESAAPGRPLNELLATSGRTRAKRAAIDAIAEWVIGVGVETSGASGALTAERSRLAHLSAPASVAVALLPTVPGVLAHHDLGTWNIVVAAGADFTVIDWESARRPAMPLWDLLYFLTDALVALDGPATPDAQVRTAISLLRGEHRSSRLFFAWVQTYANRLALPDESVGPLTTLCWEHHASSHVERSAALRDTAAGQPAPPPAELSFLARLAAPWAADTALGPDWSAWRTSRT